ncbi:MAG: NUDIX domain-containing protein [Candidatus Uhrbacteria bacterium]|nr:NUDIX domain-containing protein [Patescibacteria group bacterium]MBU1906819.1 NUDIX domain-containing protein [Patescibacteria group bacterium]
MPGSTRNLTKRSKSSSASNKHSRKVEDGQPSRREVSAGGLVFKHTREGVKFAMIKDGFGKWTFTKGHVRRGEKLVEAARRETCEETGICELKHLARLGTIDIWFKDRFVHKGVLVHKYIHYFLFEAPARARITLPKPKENGERISRAAWVPVAKVLERSSYDDMKPMIKKALSILRKKNLL